MSDPRIAHNLFIISGVTTLENRRVLPFCGDSESDEWMIKVRRLNVGEIWAGITYALVHLFSPMDVSELYPWYKVLGVLASLSSGCADKLVENFPKIFFEGGKSWKRCGKFRDTIRSFQLRRDDAKTKEMIRNILVDPRTKSLLERAFAPFDMSGAKLLEGLDEFDSVEDRKRRRQQYVFAEA